MRKTIKEMLQTVMLTGKAAILAAVAAASAAFPSLGNDSAFARGTSAAGRPDLRTGTRIVTEGAAEHITYSPRWGNAANCTVTETGRATLVAAATDEGTVSWTSQGEGVHTLTYTAGDLTYTARFAVLGDDVEIHTGPILPSEVWDTNKVHLVTSPIIVGDDYDFSYFCEIEIQAGAIVKFMPGSGISIKSNAYCRASEAIFTHVNDDTIGGDTLMDGDSISPVMDDYQVPRMLLWDDTIEFRYREEGRSCRRERGRGWP